MDWSGVDYLRIIVMFYLLILMYSDNMLFLI